ncbi:tape measure protein [Cellulomonas iranensis]|uniref:Tape measure domain-containing protein n=1 Tax=Cellulomonas iranensis TaxID=76862 RepID=A0ABU0GFZ1_9CELL|nr:tape measure protein [Cellulomonas iranensis]MDQ0424277.1 tape measure domain-containing protein [Cellulomonas iranensis]
MSLGDAYTLGVRLTGDTSSLRQELAAAAALVKQFTNTTTEALNRAATASTRSTESLQGETSRTARANKTRATSFDEYMRRVEAAERQAARASRDSADEVERATARTQTSLTGVGRSLGRLAGFSGLAVLAKQVWDAGRGFHEFSQNSEIALGNLLGGADRAKSFLADILDFAKQTPFSFPELTESAQQLLAMNVNATEVIPTLRALGDAAASQGRGIERVQQLASVLGQVSSVGKLTGETMLRLQEAGVPALAGMANLAGVTSAEFQTMVSDGLIPADRALSDLRTVINDGTSGINGTTVAMGGLMEQIKGAGGLTATTDSAKSAFRNMSAELVESLIPAYTALMRTATDGMGSVRQAADTWNALPAPVQASTVAFVAATVALRRLNVEGRAKAAWLKQSSLWRTYQGNVGLALDRQVALGREMSVTRARMSALGPAARSAGSALVGAFGGPVGLAVTGLTVVIGALVAANAEARARAEELAGTLDEQTGALTGNTDAWIQNELAKEKSFGLAGIGSMSTMVEMADKIGVSIDTLTQAYEGNATALAEAKKAADEYEAANMWSITADHEAYRFRKYLDDQANGLKNARRLVEAKNRVDKAQNANLDEGATKTQQYTAATRVWAEEQQKAIDAQADAARKASQISYGTLDLDLATDEDLATARERVAEATRKVRNEEADREDTYARKKVSANDKVKADDAAREAREALASATEELRGVEARRDPVEQYKKKANDLIEAARTFKADIETLTAQGLNATDLAAIIAAGPEGSVDTRKALLGDPSLIDFTNEARTTIDALSSEIAAQARVNQSVLEAPGLDLGANLVLGMQIAAKEGSASTVQEIANALGQDPQLIYNVGHKFGLSFMAGFSDASRYQPFADGSFRVPGGPTRGYATGGIFPGYTPGRDVGYIGVSGGEAIMRPEWTRAVGPDFVHMMNRIARTAGVGGVREAMGRYLGGFANGGIPQVVTVPVSSTHERYSPVTVQKAYVVNADSLGLYGDRTRQQRNTFGGNRG